MEYKVGDKVVILNMDGTGIPFSQNAKVGVKRKIYRIDEGNFLSIILKINNRLYGFNECNLKIEINSKK